MQETISALRHEVNVIDNKLKCLLEMGTSFARIKNLDYLLESILTNAKIIANCEAGAIFLLETISGENKKVLKFRSAQNDKVTSSVLLKGAVEFNLPLSKESITGYVATTKNSLNIEDAYNIDKNKPYKFDNQFDKKISYKTKSILSTPIINSEGEVIGVLDLINRLESRELKESNQTSDEKGCPRYMSFLPQDIEIVKWIAGLAGVTVENIYIINELKDRNIKLKEMVTVAKS